VDLATLRGPNLWAWSILGLLNGLLTTGAGSGGLIGGQPLWLMMLQGPFARPMGMNPGGPSGIPREVLMFGMPVLQLVGACACLGCWVFLYLFFMVRILPMLIPQAAPTGKSKDPRAVEWRRERQALSAAGFLRRSYQLLIIAAAMKLAPDVLTMLLPWLSQI
jgi:hypothetical protein